MTESSADLDQKTNMPMAAPNIANAVAPTASRAGDEPHQPRTTMSVDAIPKMVRFDVL